MSLPTSPIGDSDSARNSSGLPPTPRFPGFSFTEEDNAGATPAPESTSLPTQPQRTPPVEPAVAFSEPHHHETIPQSPLVATRAVGGDYEGDARRVSRIEDYPPQIAESINLLLDAIADDESTEVILNGPTQVLYKLGGARYQLPDVFLGDTETYHTIINDFILTKTNTDKRVTPTAALVEGRLTWHDLEGDAPTMARVTIVAPPVVQEAKVTIAKKARHSITLDDIVSFGSMTYEMGEFLKAAAKARTTIVFSGLSGSGKTTLLEAMSYHFDGNDRVLVVEDTPELRLPISDTLYMTTTPYVPGMDKNTEITMDWLVKIANRKRGDRVLVGEIRGGEMSEFLIAANSGADGSMTTLHAANPRMALEKMLSLAMKGDGARNEQTVRREIAFTVHLIVQASLIDGKHIITNIEEVSDVVGAQGNIATQSLFEYDRNTKRHFAGMRPSENLQSYMAQRGVEVDREWFLNSN